MPENERPVPEAPTPEVYEAVKQPRRLKRSIFPDWIFWGQGIYDNFLPKLPFLDKHFRPQKGTKDYGEARTFTRREFFIGSINLLQGIAYAYGAYKLIEANQLIDRFTNPRVANQTENIHSQEAVMTYLLNGPSSDPKTDGVSVFARDVAIASLGINGDNQQPVNFVNRNSWGHSELVVLFGGLDSFFNDLSSTSGRKDLRERIVKMEGEKATADLLKIDHFEKYLQGRHLQPDVSISQISSYFTASKADGGLGYPVDRFDLIRDSLTAYRGSSITPALKDRLNQVNVQSGTDFRIP